MASELDEREHDFILQIPALLNSQTYVWIGQYRDKTKNFQWTDESEWKKWDGRGDYGKMPWARNEPSEETGRDCTRLQTRVPDLVQNYYFLSRKIYYSFIYRLITNFSKLMGNPMDYDWVSGVCLHVKNGTPFFVSTISQISLRLSVKMAIGKVF